MNQFHIKNDFVLMLRCHLAHHMVIKHEANSELRPSLIHQILLRPYLLIDPVDDSGVLLRAVDRRLDAVLQQRVEDAVLLDGVGVHALEAPHRQLRKPVRKPLSIACNK